MSAERMFRARIQWLNTETGATGTWTDPKDGSLWIDEDTHAIDPCMWEDGNFACDCNRGIFFAGDDVADASVRCGEKKWVITKMDALNPDGTLFKANVYSEKEPR